MSLLLNVCSSVVGFPSEIVPRAWNFSLNLSAKGSLMKTFNGGRILSVSFPLPVTFGKFIRRAQLNCNER